MGNNLAVGTAKGNLLLYRLEQRKKIPVLGKHSKKITCGAWSLDNRLALGSEDKNMTLSSSKGDTLEQVPALPCPAPLFASPRCFCCYISLSLCAPASGCHLPVCFA